MDILSVYKTVYSKQWLMEHHAALQMLELFDAVLKGEVKWDYSKAVHGEEPRLSSYKMHQQFFAKDGIVMSPDNSYDMQEFKGFDGAKVAVIPVSGPLMKSDFCGSFGTASLKRMTDMASATRSVETILFIHDSPGGTVDGTQSFADAIKLSPKRTISLVDGMMASADYWIGSASDELYASSFTDIIGSIGTMCSFYDRTEAMNKNGVVLRQFYASASVDKNKSVNDAVKGDGRALIAEMLDPLNDAFMGSVRENRKGKLDMGYENVLTGKTYTSVNAENSGLIDGVKSLEQVMELALSGSGKKYKIKSEPKNIKMENTIKTLVELKAAYPALVTEAHNEGIDDGVKKERDRVTAALTYVTVDAEAVKAEIIKGEPISETFREQMMEKKMNQKLLGNLHQGNTNPQTEPVNLAAKAETEAISKARIDRYKKANGIA